MFFEVKRATRTMGSVTVPRDPRVIATLKDGKEITVDVSAMNVVSFRAYLQRLLGKDNLSDESRKNIQEALDTPK